MDRYGDGVADREVVTQCDRWQLLPALLGQNERTSKNKLIVAVTNVPARGLASIGEREGFRWGGV